MFCVALLALSGKADGNRPEHDTREITIKVLMDQDLLNQADERVLRKRILDTVVAASKTLEEEKLRISLTITDYLPWKIQPDKKELDLKRAVDPLERMAKDDEADIFLGITVRPLFRCLKYAVKTYDESIPPPSDSEGSDCRIKQFGITGAAYSTTKKGVATGRGILIRIQKTQLRVYANHPQADELVLLHELGHIFGISGHSLDERSIMHKKITGEIFDEKSRHTILENRMRRFK